MISNIYARSFTTAHDDHTAYRWKSWILGESFQANFRNCLRLYKNKLLWDEASEQRTNSTSSIIQFRKNNKCLLLLRTTKGIILLYCWGVRFKKNGVFSNRG